jgi:tetratricopeptide (TPR) repeat protein
VELDTLPTSARELTVSTVSAHEGDRTHLIGSPGASPRVLEYVTGFVRSVKRRDFPYSTIAAKEGRLVVMKEEGKQVDASITELTTDDEVGPGFSGGPVVNEDRVLIGVISYRPGERGVIWCIDSMEVPSVLGIAYRQLASRAIGKREYGRAVTLCGKSLKYNPKDPLTYNERGAAYSHQDRFDDAIRDYEAAIRLDPKHARTHRNLASALYYKEKYHLCIASCDDAIRLEPNYALAYLTRSKARAKLKQNEAAEADHARALRLDPSLGVPEKK